MINKDLGGGYLEGMEVSHSSSDLIYLFLYLHLCRSLASYFI